MAHGNHLLKSLERALELKVVHTAQCERGIGSETLCTSDKCFPAKHFWKRRQDGAILYEGRNLGKIDSI